MKALKTLFTPLALATSLTFSGFALADTITVQHVAGETTLDTNPQRVVVMGLGSLDVLDTLGIEPVGMVKTYLPSYLEKYQADEFKNVGSMFEPDFETIFTLKPDLIIASPRTAPLAEELSKIAPTVVFQVDSAGYWESTQQNWRMIGKIFEKEKEIEEYITQYQTQIDDIRQFVEAGEIDALTVMTNGGNLSAFGEQSRFSSIYKDFGFKEAQSGIVESTHGNLISFEYVASANPSVMFVLDRDQALGRGDSAGKALLDNDLVNGTKAAKNNHITIMDGNAWYLTAGGMDATQVMIDDIRSVLDQE
ncbi:siderophore ABC transporter substrate-binding protein [Thaumasiovibrio subtropicus]|uniref:siderophore ABC transporter substrate-binding protein n=1 Tax=Thaumasiovibrio subtropicus TaxID=1891207 RepID=UPI000B35EEFA|nr:ABC transporter substrate-binding protein [Thaumasiovibrio subtropicus]